MPNNEEFRQRFEAEFPNMLPNYMASDFFALDRREDGIYEKIAVQCMWIGYQAGVAQATN